MAFDLIIVGTGFASSFFLREYLSLAPSAARVLVLERGQRRSHKWQLDNLGALHKAAQEVYTNRNSDKSWVFNLAFGGGSNCWWACTPRMLPADFELKSRYGVGDDWPVSYDDLEPHYAKAEAWMQVSGPSERTPFRRSTPYPQPPHRWSTPDQMLADAFEEFYVQPTARAREGTGRRPACCSNGVCKACPIDSKFRIGGEMVEMWADPRVEVKFGANVERLTFDGDRISAVHWTGEAAGEASGDVIAIGANAIFNAHILLRSGHDHPELGRGLLEQASVSVTVDLDGVQGFDGSTSITGHGYMFYDGEHRRDRAAALVETVNVPLLRAEPGRWRDRVMLKFVYEDIRRAENRVVVDPEQPSRPALEWVGHSEYTERAVARLDADLETLLSSLPVQSIKSQRNITESHIMCTVPMGRDSATSVVDEHLTDHRFRNLRVLGASAFPTAPPANPSLTICALSIRSAQQLFGVGA